MHPPGEMHAVLLGTSAHSFNAETFTTGNTQVLPCYPHGSDSSDGQGPTPSASHAHSAPMSASSFVQ